MLKNKEGSDLETQKSTLLGFKKKQQWKNKRITKQPQKIDRGVIFKSRPPPQLKAQLAKECLGV